MISKDLDQPTQFVAWAAVDNQRWILADDSGSLYFLMLLLTQDDEVDDWQLHTLGKTSQASVLVYLDEGFVFVGSHQGDSQIIKIVEHGIDLIQTISNIAPILDFAIMDMGNRSGEGQTNEYSSGQARLVTGSGAFQDGSLRSVRSGVGLEEQGLLGEMDHATNLFALRSTTQSEFDDILLVSFVDESRFFQFQVDGEVAEQSECKGLITSESTILACSLETARLLQVTATCVKLIDSENAMCVAEWHPSPDGQITAASANETCLMLSIGGMDAFILDLSQELQVKATRTFPEEGQISCIHVSPLSAELCMAGFWKTADIVLMISSTLETVTTVNLSEDAATVPRSILLAPILAEQLPTLFVGMANGEVVTFALDPNTAELTSKKTMVLGTEEASFKQLPRDNGISSVFATCEHPSLIYGSEGRIVYSAITAEKTTSVCSFNSEQYPGAIAIATSEDIRIALVDTERTTHVQTLPVAQTVRRIAYSAKLKAFGLGTIQRSLRGLQEVVQSHFKLADEVLFKTLDSYELNEEELVESVTRAEIVDDSGEPEELFVVGTAFLEDDSNDAIRGRILVFSVTMERGLSLVTEQRVKGACRALGYINGHIVAALSKTVFLTPPNSLHGLY